MNRNSRRDMGFWYHREYDPVRNGSMDGTDVYAHDHGLVRASQCHYDCQQNSEFEGDPYKTLFVGRLSPLTTEETLQQAFSRYGKIKSLRLVRDLITGCSKRYAFVEYVYEEDFSSAFFAGHRTQLDNSTILVDFMREQTVPGWIPRRLGGGVGGRKQSGQMRFGGRDCPFRAPFDITVYRSRTKDTGSTSSHNSRSTSSTEKDNYKSSRNAESQLNKFYEQRKDYRRDDHRGNADLHNDEKRVVSHQGFSASAMNRQGRNSSDYEHSRRERNDSSHSSNHTYHRSRLSRSRSRSKNRSRNRSRSRSRSRSYHHYHHSSSSSHHHSHHSSSHRHYFCFLNKKM